MSNYLGKANNPNTGNLEDCEFLDDFYGKRQYAVRFKDGTTYPESEVEGQPMNEHKPEPWEDIEKAYPEAYRLARRFHELYEEYAPQFGYKTREDTRAFDPTSPNGRTMARVAYEVVQEENTAKYHEGYKQGRFDQKIEGNADNAERIRGLLIKVPSLCTLCVDDGLDQGMAEEIQEKIEAYNDGVMAAARIVEKQTNPYCMNYQPAEQMNHPKDTGGTLLYDIHCGHCKIGRTHPYEGGLSFTSTANPKATYENQNNSKQGKRGNRKDEVKRQGIF